MDFEIDVEQGIPMFGRHFVEIDGRTFKAVRQSVADVSSMPSRGSRLVWRVTMNEVVLGDMPAWRNDSPESLEQAVKALWNGTEGETFRTEHPNL